MKTTLKFLSILLAIMIFSLSSCKKDYSKDWTENKTMIVEGKLSIDGRIYYTVQEGFISHWDNGPVDLVKGFTWEEGYRFTLSVECYHYGKPAVNTHPFHYSLIEIISKEKSTFLE